MSTASEILSILDQRAKSGAGVPLHHAQVVSDAVEYIHWIDGMGLYSMVQMVGQPHDGELCKCVVGGNLFAIAPGMVWNRPLRMGEHVLVALIDGVLEGQAVIVSRIANLAANPPKQGGFANVDEYALANHAFDVHPPGERLFEQFGGKANSPLGDGAGGRYTRLMDDAGWQVALPDGGVFDIQKDAVNGGWTFKLKAGNGGLILHSQAGTSIRSPSGTSYIEVTDAGIFLHGPVVKTEGVTMLGFKPSDVPTPAIQSAIYGPSGMLGVASTSVFVGK